MGISELFQSIGVLVSTLAALAGVWWGFEKWRRRDEHFPRVYFEVGVNFLGVKDSEIVVELIATIENKGVVPLKIRNFSFKLLGLSESDRLQKGSASIRGQINFPNLLEEGLFIGDNWNYTFIYPGVKTEYNYVAAIPSDLQFVRMQGDFEYLSPGRSHHAAKVLRVPNNQIN